MPYQLIREKRKDALINRPIEPTTNIRYHASDLKKAARSLANDLHIEATNKFGPNKSISA
jgi:hypothetical protein